MNEPCKWVLVFGQTKLFVDDELNGHGASNAGFSRGGDRFVVSVGMQ